MPDVKISGLPAAASANAAMELEVNDAGTSRKVTVTQIKAVTDVHTHAIADITGLVTALAGKSDTTHVHDAAAITTGLVSINRLPTATAANFRAGNTSGCLTNSQVWAAAAEVGLTDAASIAMDMNNGLNFVVTLAGNRTLANPTNAKIGQSGWIRVAQDATGGRTLAFGTNWRFENGTAYSIATGANQQTLLFYTVYATGFIAVTGVRNI